MLNFSGFVNLGVVGDDGEVSKERRGVRPVEGLQQIEKEPGLFALPRTLRDGSRGDISGPS